ncbi:MAG: hypothetical protein ABSD50_16025 [Smithella sp.]
MNTKGIFYTVTKASMVAFFGEERWNAFMTKMAEKDNYFSKVIMTITLEMCKEFFNNDRMQYVTFGTVSAQYALSPDGPYKSFMLTKDIKQFVEIYMPKLWSTYFDEGECITKFENNVAHLKITGIQIKNLYFEYLAMGYFQKALKMFGKKSVAKKIRSLASGDNDVYFQFELKES